MVKENIVIGIKNVLFFIVTYAIIVVATIFWIKYLFGSNKLLIALAISLLIFILASKKKLRFVIAIIALIMPFLVIRVNYNDFKSIAPYLANSYSDSVTIYDADSFYYTSLVNVIDDDTFQGVIIKNQSNDYTVYNATDNTYYTFNYDKPSNLVKYDFSLYYSKGYIYDVAYQEGYVDEGSQTVYKSFTTIDKYSVNNLSVSLGKYELDGKAIVFFSDNARLVLTDAHNNLYSIDDDFNFSVINTFSSFPDKIFKTASDYIAVYQNALYVYDDNFGLKSTLLDDFTKVDVLVYSDQIVLETYDKTTKHYIFNFYDKDLYLLKTSQFASETNMENALKIIDLGVKINSIIFSGTYNNLNYLVDNDLKPINPAGYMLKPDFYLNGNYYAMIGNSNNENSTLINQLNDEDYMNYEYIVNLGTYKYDSAMTILLDKNTGILDKFIFGIGISIAYTAVIYGTSWVLRKFYKPLENESKYK